jgi:hypothetical protein
MRLMGCGSQDDAVKRPRLMVRLSQSMARKTKNLEAIRWEMAAQLAASRSYAAEICGPGS